MAQTSLPDDPPLEEVQVVSDGYAADELSPASGKPRDLTAYFVDACRARNGADPPRRVVGHIGKELEALTKEKAKHSADVLTEAIDILIEKGLDPSALASCVFTAQSQLRGISRADRQLLREYLATIRASHGISWPTGSRWVRGDGGSAGSYIEDPLGTDTPSHDVPWPRPSRDELVRALRERGTDG